MTGSTPDRPRKRPDQTGTFLGVRLQPDALARLDAWIARQRPPLPSRPEAIRRLMEMGLAREGEEQR